MRAQGAPPVGRVASSRQGLLCSPFSTSRLVDYRESLQHIAEGGSFSEEVISTIRTAQALGNQIRLARVYGGHIDQAFVVDLKAAIVHGAGLAFFFFIIYASYALAFYFGTTLLLQGYGVLLTDLSANRADEDDQGNAGTIINVVMAILTGSFSLALLAPEVQGTNL